MSIPVQPRRSGIPFGPILLIALALGGVATLALHSGFMHKAHSEGVKPVDAGSTIRTSAGPLPGMPPVLDPKDIYAAARPGNLSPTAQAFPSRVYVPNSESRTVTVIDPATFRVLYRIPVEASRNMLRRLTT